MRSRASEVDVYSDIISAPSLVSSRHMPAVKSKGNSRISQMDVPRAAWMEEMPRRAISEEVSKPRPKRTPRGYIFQGLEDWLVSWLVALGWWCLFFFSSSFSSSFLRGLEDEPVNHSEHALEDVEEASGAVDLEVLVSLLAGVGGDQRVQLLHQAVQDVYVHNAQQDQEGGGHGGADDATDLGKPVKLVRHGGCRGGNDDGGDYDNPGKRGQGVLSGERSKRVKCTLSGPERRTCRPSRVSGLRQ